MTDDRIMTQTTSRFFDELAKVMTNAAGAAQGMRREVDVLIRAQAERVLGDLDVVQREEFEALREMAVLAREENERLEARVTALEAKLAAKPKTSARAAKTSARTTKTAAAKPAAKAKTVKAKTAKPAKTP
ncbi:FIG018229: hypothetical protein [hydrothermal vent metagenome]|uniref:Accessory factor UbiK family protein n=1 Tax=hydrothermal vent metagenome TaxID=652676 RepID=A0A3B0TVI9_9ZZZZ